MVQKVDKVEKDNIVERGLQAFRNVVKNVIAPPLDKFLSATCPYIPDNAKNMWANYPDKKGRPMIYPYTFTAKLIQFPYQQYFTHGWALKYYLIAVLFSMPVMYKMTLLVSTPENIEYWNGIREEWYGPDSYAG